MDEKHLAEKLYEISAENFGRRVHEFYLDVIISNNFAKETGADEPVTKRFLKTVFYLPQQAVIMPVKGSKRMLKASKKQLNNFRDFLKE